MLFIKKSNYRYLLLNDVMSFVALLHFHSIDLKSDVQNRILYSLNLDITYEDV